MIDYYKHKLERLLDLITDYQLGNGSIVDILTFAHDLGVLLALEKDCYEKKEDAEQ